jgi:hypothetical protein
MGVYLPLGSKKQVGGGGRRGGGQSVSCTIALLGNSYEGMEKVGIPIPRAMRICHLGDFTVVRFDNYLEVSTHSSRAASATCGDGLGQEKQQSVISCRRCHLSSRVLDPPSRLRASADMHQTSGV